MLEALWRDYRKVDTLKANSYKVRVEEAWCVIIAPFSFPIPSESVSEVKGAVAGIVSYG